MFRQDFVHCCVTDYMYLRVASKNNPYTSKTIMKGSQTELQRRISDSGIVYFEHLYSPAMRLSSQQTLSISRYLVLVDACDVQYHVN